MLKKFNLKSIFVLFIFLFWLGKDKFYDHKKIKYQKVKSLAIKTKKSSATLNELVERGFFNHPQGQKSLAIIEGKENFLNCDSFFDQFFYVQKKSENFINSKSLFPDYAEEIAASQKALKSILSNYSSRESSYRLTYLNMEAAELFLSTQSSEKGLRNILKLKTLDSASSIYQLENTMVSLFQKDKGRPSFLAYCRNEKDFKGHELQFYEYPMSFHLNKVKPKQKLSKKNLFKLAIPSYFLDPLTLFSIVPYLPIDGQKTYIYPLIVKEKNFLAFIKTNVRESLIYFTISLISTSSTSEPFSLELSVTNNSERILKSFNVDLPLGKLQARLSD